MNNRPAKQPAFCLMGGVEVYATYSGCVYK